MKLTNVEIKSTDSPILHIDAEFVAIRDEYSVGRYLGELVKRNVDVEIVHKSNNCCKPTTRPEMPVPEKIFRCGDATTVIWKDGTKTTVKLMPGAEDSDYGAFTAALAKKIYGGNSKVMKYAGMVQRVKSKAEKKATRKLKRKYEEKITGEKKYIVSQYGQVAECKDIETDSMGVGEKVIIFAETESEARRKAIYAFRKGNLLTEWVVFGDTTTYEIYGCADDLFGKWGKSSINGLYSTAVFAKDAKEAERVLSIIPAPIPF